MSQTYEYVIATEVPAGKVHAGALSDAVKASASITKTLQGITIDSGKCHIMFDSALDAAEKAALDALIADHPGYGFDVKYHTSSMLLAGEAEVVGPDWVEIGAVFTNPQFFLGDNLAGGKGRVVGQVKTEGAGAQLRLVESNDSDVVVALYDVPDTAGAWAPAKFFTTVQCRPGDQRYRFEAKLGAASSFSVRAFSVSLLEFSLVQGQS